MSNYKRGQNPRSHNNKPKTDKQRVVIPVVCSTANKRAIDKALRHIKPRFRSKHIVNLMLAAIAANKTDLDKSAANDRKWQISINPDDRAKIYTWCDRNLPDRSRSKWIVNVILTSAD